MKNQEVWSNYKDYTRDITEFSRKLAFGGLAICWFFKGSDLVFPKLILASLLFFILFFIFDILQSLTGALLLRLWIRSEENRLWEETGSIDQEYNKPAWLDGPSYGFFIFKIISIFVAFGLIIFHIVSNQQFKS